LTSNADTPHVITVMAVDDHPLLLDGVRAALSEQSDMKLIAEVMSGRDAIAQCRLHRPNVTLMDVVLKELARGNANREIAAQRIELMR
jgi:DNA-binding NarL/FixJ family response regulator